MVNISTDLRKLDERKKSLQQKLDDLKKETVVYESTKQQLISSNRYLTRVTEQLAVVTRQLGTQDQKLVEIREAENTKSTLEKESNELKAEILEYKAVKKRLQLVKNDLADANVMLAGRQKELSLANDQLSKVKKDLAGLKAKLFSVKKRLGKSAD